MSGCYLAGDSNNGRQGPCGAVPHSVQFGKLTPFGNVISATSLHLLSNRSAVRKVLGPRGDFRPSTHRGEPELKQQYRGVRVGFSLNNAAVLTLNIAGLWRREVLSKCRIPYLFGPSLRPGQKNTRSFKRSTKSSNPHPSPKEMLPSCRGPWLWSRTSASLTRIWTGFGRRCLDNSGRPAISINVAALSKRPVARIDGRLSAEVRW